MAMCKRRCARKQNNNDLEAQKQVTSLPHDIMSNIFLRLPAESIFDCRGVCKSWSGLTIDPSFIKAQLGSTTKKDRDDNESCQYILQSRYGVDSQSLMLLDINELKLTEISFKKMKLPASGYPNQNKLSSFYIVSSCNGLLCLAPKEKIDPVLICNPIIRECMILPSTITGFEMLQLPSKSYQLGFHFDPLSPAKYKVIREYRFFHSEVSKFQVITIGEKSWRDLTNVPSFVIEQGFEAAIYWNGAFHWKISEFDHRYEKQRILGFDLLDEKFYVISFRDQIPDEDALRQVPRNFQLVGLGGELKIVEYEHSRFLNIWTVSGNKVEGFLISLQHRFVFCVPRRRFLQHDFICEIGMKCYLVQVFKWKHGLERCSLARFSPGVGMVLDLDVNGLPSFFRMVCFKPSLVSPFVASRASS